MSVATVIDRSIAVPSGAIVRTGYMELHKVRLACRERMAVGDVNRAYQKRLQLGDQQPFPCPNGYWDGDCFVRQDGGHEYVATLMIGYSTILVSWGEHPGTNDA